MAIVNDPYTYFGYRIYIPDKGMRPKSSFSEREKKVLRPIAEVLAMLDGNAFFGGRVDDDGDDTWYEQYLPEAYVVYSNNGGHRGWASEASFIKRNKNG